MGDVIEEIKKRGWLLLFLLIGVVAAAFLPVAASIYFIALALLLLGRGFVAEFFLLFYLLIFFSDSRSALFSFAQDTKTILTLLLPIAALRAPPAYRQIMIGFLPFFVFSFVLIGLSPTPTTSFQKTLSYSLLVFSTPLVLLYFLQTEGPAFLRTFFRITFLLLFTGLLLIVFNPSLVFLSERFRGLLGNPNGLGIFLVVVFLFYQTALVKFPTLFEKKEKYLFTAVFILSLLLCQSRSALLVFLLFFAMVRLFRYSQLLGVISVLVALTAVNYVTFDIVSIIHTLGLEEYFRVDTLEEGSGRVVAWQFAWENIQRNFFFGQGFAFNEFLYQKYFIYLSNLGHQGNVHNAFLTLWLDTGLIGLLLFLLPLVYLFFKATAYTRIALPVFFCFMISTNFESWLAASLNPFTIVFFMTLTLLLYQPEEESMSGHHGV